MLITFCYPFLDLRYLLANRRVPLPNWHWARSDQEPEWGARSSDFVGELGRVQRRTERGERGVLGIDKTVRFLDRPAWNSVAGRNILADLQGQVQAEIGFLVKAPPNVDDLLARIGHTQVLVPKASL